MGTIITLRNNAFDEMLDETAPTIKVAGYEFRASDVLYALDEIAYRTAASDFDSFNADEKMGPICPICKGFIPNNEQPGAYMGAISRVDNKTEICSQCGRDEALAGFFSRGVSSAIEEEK